jgi:hypothetical protein
LWGIRKRVGRAKVVLIVGIRTELEVIGTSPENVADHPAGASVPARSVRARVVPENKVAADALVVMHAESAEQLESQTGPRPRGNSHCHSNAQAVLLDEVSRELHEDACDEWTVTNAKAPAERGATGVVRVGGTEGA